MTRNFDLHDEEPGQGTMRAFLDYPTNNILMMWIGEKSPIIISNGDLYRNNLMDESFCAAVYQIGQMLMSPKKNLWGPVPTEETVVTIAVIGRAGKIIASADHLIRVPK